MKKLLMLAFSLICLSACHPKQESGGQVAGQATSSADAGCPVGAVCKTLNGFKMDDALTMIKYFKKSFDDNTVNTNVSNDVGPKSVDAWLSVDEIKKINDLLINEKARADGIRVYLGADDPGTGKKLNVHVFIVTTRPRTRTDLPGTSTHIDYYDHDVNANPYLNHYPAFGDAFRDDAMNGPARGAYLYDIPATTMRKFPQGDNCKDRSKHYVKNEDALQWAQKRRHNANATTNGSNDMTGYNTRSEWFDYDFITQLFGIILNRANQFSGLRIYLGEGHYENPARDCFLLVPTKLNDGVNGDYYGCIEKYFKIPSKNNSSNFVVNNQGELCPDKCN